MLTTTHTIPHLILSRTVLFLLYRWNSWHLRRPESCERSHLHREVAWRWVCFPDLHSYQHCVAHVDIPKGAGAMKEGIGSTSLSTEQGAAEAQMGTKCFSKISVPKARWDQPAVRDKFSIAGEVVTTSHSLFSVIKILRHGGGTCRGNNNSLTKGFPVAVRSQSFSQGVKFMLRWHWTYSFKETVLFFLPMPFNRRAWKMPRIFWNLL